MKLPMVSQLIPMVNYQSFVLQIVLFLSHEMRMSMIVEFPFPIAG